MSLKRLTIQSVIIQTFSYFSDFRPFVSQDILQPYVARIYACQM